MATAQEQKRISIRVEANFYQTLETIARQEKRTLPQAVRLLLEEGLRQHNRVAISEDDIPGSEIAKLAMAGGAFDWLEAEPDLYDETCGEPV